MIVNARMEASKIVAQLTKGESNELGVSFGAGGRIVARGVDTATFKRLSADDEWVSKKLIAVYQWGVQKSDIEQDIRDAVESAKPKAGAACKVKLRADNPPRRKCKKLTEGRKRLVRPNVEIRAAILAYIATRDRLTQELRDTYSIEGLQRRYGVSETSIRSALKDKAAILAGKVSRPQKKITADVLRMILADLKTRDKIKKDINKRYSVAAMCRKHGMSKTAVYKLLEKAMSAA